MILVKAEAPTEPPPHLLNFSERDGVEGVRGLVLEVAPDEAVAVRWVEDDDLGVAGALLARIKLVRGLIVRVMGIVAGPVAFLVADLPHQDRRNLATTDA